MSPLALTRRIVRSPAAFLSAVNVVGAALGFVQGVLAARVLGASAYGVIAVITGINAVALNFLDVRLVDLAGRLYYRKDLPGTVDQRAYRTSVVQLCVLGNAVISLLLLGVGVVANLVALRWFTDAAVDPTWIVLQAATLAVVNWTGTFLYMQRFSGRFYLMGTWKLISQVVAMCTYLGILLSLRSLWGYFAGQFVAAAVAGTLAVGLTLHVWRADGFAIGRRHLTLAWAEYRGSVRFLAFTNALGYSKLFHRSADVLVIGLFADDRLTGVYKFARTATDSFYLLFEALGQVYTPRLLELLSGRAHDEYRRLALRITVGAAVFTAGVVALEVMLLPWLLETVLAGRFPGAAPPIIVLTLAFFLVAGVYLWVWPLFVQSGRLGAFTAASLTAALVQYAVTFAGFAAAGVSPVFAATGYVAYYVVLLAAALAIVARRRPEVLPWRATAAHA